MSFKLGNTNIGELYVGSNKIAKAYLGSNLVYQTTTPPGPGPEPEPVILPAYTIRCKFKSGYTPTMGNTQTLVDSTNNVWDIYEDNYWNGLFDGNSNLLQVLGANPENIWDLGTIFRYCNSLTYVVAFDTSNVQRMVEMFRGCSSLIKVPLLNTSIVFDMSYMFLDCTNVQSGSLALYQQASSQTTPPLYHDRVFTNCGSNTTTGAAELAQIPDSWK